MRNILILLAFCLSSCKIIRKIENYRVNPVTEKEMLTPLQQSYSTIPISIPLQSFYEQLKKQLNQYIIQNEHYPGYSDIPGDKQVKFVMRIDELYFENINTNTLRIRFKINYVLWGKAKILGQWVSVDCENDGDKWLGMSVDVKLPYPMTSESYGSANVTGHSFYNTECELGFELWDEEGHEKLYSSMKCAIEKEVNRVLQKTFINSSVVALLKKLKPDYYFNTIPGYPRMDAKIALNNITFGKMQIVENKLELVVGANYNTIISTEDITPVIPVQPFTKNAVLEVSDQSLGLNNNVVLAVSYKTISDGLDSLVRKGLPGYRVHVKDWPFRFIDFKITSLKVEADEYGYLFINATTSGFPNATIVVKCYPVISSISNSLVLNDLSYSIKSKNIVYKIAKPFFKKPITRFIQHNSNIQYGPYLQQINKTLPDKVNALNVKYAEVALSNSAISIVDIKPMKEYLVIYMNHTGNSVLNVKSNDIKIHIPPGPLKVKNDGSCQ